MAVPPLVSLPASSCFATVTFSLTHVVAITPSPFTLEEQSFKWPGEKWLVSVSLPPIKDPAIAAEWKAFGLKLKGRYGYFLMGDPLGKVPRGVATGTPKVDGVAQTGEELDTKGWTANIQGIMKTGDYFQLGIGDNSRLYMLLEDVNSDASGKAKFVFSPALRSPPQDEQAIIIDNPQGVFRLTDNTWSWTERPGRIYNSISFDASEVVNA